MDQLHLYGVQFIVKIQHIFQNYEELMLILSHAGDPRNSFLIYFPLAYFLHKSVGRRVLWAAAISEWMNSVLKWFLYGQRPYWWVHETDLYTDHLRPQLLQFRLTCETGPGSPSGHAMVTSAVLYVLVSDIIFYKFSQHKYRTVISVSLWTVYGCLIIGVNMARCYIATHFPHQVIAGMITGIILGMCFSRISTSNLKLHQYISASVFLLASTILLYYGIEYIGLDPHWSITKAQTWCANLDWIHLDTSLFYAVVRDSASLAGLGVAVQFLGTDKEEKAMPSISRIIHIIISIALSIFVDSLKIPQESVLIFYFLGYMKNFIIFVVTVVVIPKSIDLASRLLDKHPITNLNKIK